MIFGNNISLNNNELQNVVLQKLAADPANLTAKIYYNTATNKIRYYNGTSWQDVGSGSGVGDVVGPASSVDGQIALFDGTTGKLLEAATTTGLLKATSGVLAAAVVGTDYVTDASTNTFTNKTFDANGTGNSITNIETADLASGVLNTSTTLTGATNTQLPSALAVKTYVDNSFDAVDAFTYKGGIDASTNPNYPAASAGDVYKITVAGRIGGASGPLVEPGDTLYCTTDGTASGDHATVGANWTIVQANVDRATDSTLGLAEYATLAEAEAKTSVLVALTPASVANFPIKKTFTIGDGVATSFPLTHNLNTQDVTVSIRKVSTNEHWFTTITCNTVNQVTLSFALAPTSNEFVVTVIG